MKFGSDVHVLLPLAITFADPSTFHQQHHVRSKFGLVEPYKSASIKTLSLVVVRFFFVIWVNWPFNTLYFFLLYSKFKVTKVFPLFIRHGVLWKRKGKGIFYLRIPSLLSMGTNPIQTSTAVYL